jgi:hypothetical protein
VLLLVGAVYLCFCLVSTSATAGSASDRIVIAVHLYVRRIIIASLAVLLSRRWRFGLLFGVRITGDFVWVVRLILFLDIG